MDKAKTATSAGVIIFRTTRGKRQYLLLKSRADDWEFPKGSIKDDEELQQAAIRETIEETGIEDLTLLDGFSDKYSYEFTVNGELIQKDVFLFIGETERSSIELCHEHSDFQWRDYEEAIRTVSHNGPKEILKSAEKFLEENNKQ